nr:hypothetical protein [Tanacetum cinerariifolium]
APHSLEYVSRDHVPVFVPEFEHPEDLVPAKGEAPTSLLPPGFLSPRIRPLSPRALVAETNAIASSLHRSLHPLGTPPLLPISTPSTSRRVRFPRLINRLRIGHYLLLLDLGVRSERVLLLLRDGKDPLWLMESIAVIWRLDSKIRREG